MVKETVYIPSCRLTFVAIPIFGTKIYIHFGPPQSDFWGFRDASVSDYIRFSSLENISVFRQALPLSVGELADANEFALVAARGLLLLCSAFREPFMDPAGGF